MVQNALGRSLGTKQAPGEPELAVELGVPGSPFRLEPGEDWPANAWVEALDGRGASVDVSVERLPALANLRATVGRCGRGSGRGRGRAALVRGELPVELGVAPGPHGLERGECGVPLGWWRVQQDVDHLSVDLGVERLPAPDDLRAAVGRCRGGGRRGDDRRGGRRDGRRGGGRERTPCTQECAVELRVALSSQSLELAEQAVSFGRQNALGYLTHLDVH